jgi:hypothetical protein
VRVVLAPVDDHAADRRVGLHRNLRVLETPRPDHLEAYPLDRRDDLVDPEALEIVGDDCGAENKKVKRWKKFIASSSRPAGAPACAARG